MSVEATDVAKPAEVRITDIEIPFGSMVTLLVKWALAAIPAVFILVVAGILFAFPLLAFIGGLAGALSHSH